MGIQDESKPSTDFVPSPPLKKQIFIPYVCNFSKKKFFFLKTPIGNESTTSFLEFSQIATADFKVSTSGIFKLNGYKKAYLEPFLF